MSFSLIRRTSALLPLMLAAACSESKPAAGPSAPAFAPDPHSYAKPAEAHVTNVSLDVHPDFATHRITATATLSIERAAGATHLVLDSRDLTITRVTDAKGGA